MISLFYLQRSSKFPHAKYFCRLCDYHCDSIEISRTHAKDARHKRRREVGNFNFNIVVILSVIVDKKVKLGNPNFSANEIKCVL